MMYKENRSPVPGKMSPSDAAATILSDVIFARDLLDNLEEAAKELDVEWLRQSSGALQDVLAGIDDLLYTL